MNTRDFDSIATYLKSAAGLSVTQDKAYWFYPRLNTVLRRFSLNDLSELAEQVRLAENDNLLHEVVEAALDTDTSFMRDHTFFKTVDTVLLPNLQKRNADSKKLRLWCAGCSSGQEAYALALLIHKNAADFAGWNIEIIGTDLSAAMISQAQSAEYSQFDVQRGLPIRLLLDCFNQEGDRWRLLPEFKKSVTFSTGNLLADFSSIGTVDMIFCRNVLSSFDAVTKKDVLARLSERVQPGAYLAIGGTESLLGLTDRWASLPAANSIYEAKA